MRKGFSLVELSIVIVIIAILIAGAYVGNVLLKQARYRVVVSEFNKYKTSYRTFQSNYNAIPGDMVNATTIWPDSSMSNGDGDGMVESVLDEDLQAWRQIAYADLIDVTYTGATSGTHAAIGINIPASIIKDAGYMILAQASNSAIYGRSKRNNGLRFGSISSGYANGGILTPSGARYIDKKMDDGLASSGEVVAIEKGFVNNASLCVTGVYTGSKGSSNYVLTDNTKSCFLEFWLD